MAPGSTEHRFLHHIARNTGKYFACEFYNHLNIDHRATHAHIQSAFCKHQFCSREKRATCIKSISIQVPTFLSFFLLFRHQKLTNARVETIPVSITATTLMGATAAHAERGSNYHQTENAKVHNKGLPNPLYRLKQLTF